MPPPETRLELVWDGSPVNFTDTVSYVCTAQYSTVQYTDLAAGPDQPLPAAGGGVGVLRPGPLGGAALPDQTGGLQTWR